MCSSGASKPRERLLRRGLLATLLAALAADLLFLPPAGRLLPGSSPDALGLGFFALMGTLLSLAADSHYRAQCKAAAFQRELAVQKSEEGFRLLVEDVKDYAIFMLDSEGRVASWNKGAQRLKGYGSEEILGRHFSCFYPPEDVTQGKPEAELRSAAKTGRFEESGWRVRKDGSRFWADVFITALRDAGGQLAGFAKVTRDMTERKLAETTLAEDKARLDRIIASAMDAIISIDAQQRIVVFNAAAEKLFGVNPGEALGQDLSRFIPQRFRAAHARHVEGFASTRASTRRMGALGTLSGLRANGEEFPIEASISQIEVRGEKLFTVILRDITERKRAEDVLRQSEERFRLFYENSPVPYQSLDSEGCFIEVNQSFLETLGCARAEVIGRSFAELMTPESAALFAERFQQFKEHGSVRGAEFELARQSGGRVHITLDGNIGRTPEGRFQQMQCVWRDTTRSKQAKEELERLVAERTAQLHEANDNLQTFAHSAAHDLRSPLRAIRSFSDIALAECGPNLDAAGRSMLERIALSADRMDQLLRDLLEYSELSQAELRLENVSLQEAVGEVLALLDRDLRARGATLTVADRLADIRGHRATVVLLISNLVSNALKFMPPGVPPQIRISAEPWEGCVRLLVQDNGIGIAPEHLGKLFGVFQRLHDKRAYPGTGLGLAIVRKGAERMGGRVGVESEVGRGSCFWVELRAAPPAD